MITLTREFTMLFENAAGVLVTSGLVQLAQINRFTLANTITCPTFGASTRPGHRLLVHQAHCFGVAAAVKIQAIVMKRAGSPIARETCVALAADVPCPSFHIKTYRVGSTATIICHA